MRNIDQRLTRLEAEAGGRQSEEFDWWKLVEGAQNPTQVIVFDDIARALACDIAAALYGNPPDPEAAETLTQQLEERLEAIRAHTLEGVTP